MDLYGLASQSDSSKRFPLAGPRSNVGARREAKEKAYTKCLLHVLTHVFMLVPMSAADAQWNSKR